MKKVTVFLTLFLILIFPFEGSAASSSAPAPEKLKMAIFNVGQGNFSLVRLPSTTIGEPVNLVVDCGYIKIGLDREVYDRPMAGAGILSSLSRRVEQYINPASAVPSTGMDTPIYMVLSHAEVDHFQLPVSEFGLFNKSYVVENALLGGDAATWTSVAARAFLKWLNVSPYNFASAIRGHLAASPMRYSLFPPGLLHAGVGVQFFLGPMGGGKNARSVMVRITYLGKSVLLSGDAEKSTVEQALEDLSAADFPATDVFLIAHHGALTGESNDPKWLGDLHAKIALFSVGPNNNATGAKAAYPATKGHPTTLVFDRVNPYCLHTPAGPPHSISLELSKEGVAAQAPSVVDATYSTFDQGDMHFEWGAGPIIRGSFSTLGGNHTFMLDAGGGVAAAGAGGEVIYVPKPAAGAGAGAGGGSTAASAGASGGGGGSSSSAVGT